jgi:multidrug efflux system membrane fusion protein
MNGKQPPVPVVVGTVVQKDVPVQIRAVGTVEPYSTVSVKPQVGGVLSRVHFKEGAEVNKGDLLFTIDPRPFQSQLAQAQANLSADIAKARNARAIATRYEGLVQKDFVTREQYDQIRTTAEALEAAVEADKAAVENVRLQLDYCTITSPLSGRTGNLLVHEGNVVKANETVTIEILQIHPINVRFAIPGGRTGEVMKYNALSKLKVDASDESGTLLDQGTLSFVDNGVDNTTGTILLKATFENKDARLWPGEFVNVRMTLTTRTKAIVVPTEAIETGQQGQFVFVIKSDMTAEIRPVQPGLALDNETVVEKGLSAGETVVTDGQLRLLPGSKVEIKTGATKSPAAGGQS